MAKSVPVSSKAQRYLRHVTNVICRGISTRYAALKQTFAKKARMMRIISAGCVSPGGMPINWTERKCGHGGHFDPSQHVEISFVRSRRAITCRVKDSGQGFSPDELRHAAAGTSLEDLINYVAVREEKGLRPGGFGMLMAKKLVDELIYDEKGNDVLLIKYLTPPAISPDLPD